MTDRKPIWQENVRCYICYACINYCPAQSVQLRSAWYMHGLDTPKLGRYSHPYATADDIAGEKEREAEK